MSWPSEPTISARRTYPTQWAKAKTLRERSLLLLLPHSYAENHTLLDELMSEAWRERRYTDLLVTQMEHPHPKMHEGLQDLANIVAWEAGEAYSATYYPRLPDVDIPESHVKRVMAGLQREMDREANRTHREGMVFDELPWDRQCALAERRRYWYGLYGITPDAWDRWSLWRVSDTVEIPEEVRRLYE